MKIYQIHEIRGQYTDYCDTIVGTYLNKETARRELFRLCRKVEESKKMAQRCSKCPWYLDDQVPPVVYCPGFSEDLDTEDCKNYVSDDDFPSYVIREEVVLDAEGGVMQ